LISY